MINNVPGTSEAQGEYATITSFHNLRGRDKWLCAELLTERLPAGYKRRAGRITV